MNVLRIVFLCVIVCAGFAQTGSPLHADDDVPSSLPPPANVQIDFGKHIEPLLRGTCLSCHGPEEQEGGLRLDLKDRALALETGYHVDVVEPTPGSHIG